MKSSILLTVFCLSLNSALAQTIYTADNNPGAIGGVNIFTGATALQDAIDPAVNTSLVTGDIIHVTRSAVDYGAITITLPLEIIGIGLDPDTDGSEISEVSTINIEDPIASGTRISGVKITTILNLGGVAGNLSNLLLENSRIKRIQHTSNTTTLSNIVVRNNVFSGGVGSEEKIDFLIDYHSNVIIANNVIYGSTDNTNGGSITANNGTSVENNLFINGDGNDDAFQDFYGNTVKNNIFIGVGVNSIDRVTNNTFENNLSFGCATRCAFPTTAGNTSSGNLINVDPLMANVPTGYSIDFATFNLTLNTVTPSPAINAGEDGTNIGPSGGPAPFSREGTLIPTIQSLTLPSLILKGDDLTVEIKAKGN